MGAIAEAVGGAIQGFANTGVSIANLIMQKKAYDQNQSNIEETWKREDTAVQRRVKDLEAAGLSPTLAAGSAASSTSPISLNAPQMSKLDGVSGVLNSIIQGKTIAQQNANIAYTKAQTDLIKKQTDNLQVDYERNERNFGLEVDSGMHSNASTGGKIARDVANALGVGADDLKDKAQSAWDNRPRWLGGKKK